MAAMDQKGGLEDGTHRLVACLIDKNIYGC